MNFWLPAVNAAFVIALYSLTLPAAWGQNPAANQQSGGVTVAVIDVPRVFEGHPGFKQQMKAINTDVNSLKQELVGQRQQISNQQKRLNQYGVGSPEYKQADAEITRQLSDLQVREQLKKKELLVREAKIYFDTYNEVLREVQAIASGYGIRLVVRYDSKAIDPQNRASVLKGVNRAVVYQKDLDITELVLSAIQTRYNNAGRR